MRTIDEEDEDIILDPILAALVNIENEIIVNDTLYHFTDYGLFFSKVQDSTSLFDYLEESFEEYNEINILEERINNSGVESVDENVYRYVASIDDTELENQNNNLANTPNSTYNTTNSPELQTIINNLPVCSGTNNWVQNIFGKSYWCISKWDDRHRLKTEFWDQRWMFYASVGVLTKSQTRTLGIWWASKADEIHLGINRVKLTYNYPIPDINYLSHPPINGRKKPIYMYDGQFKVRSDYFGGYFVDTSIQLVDSSLPFF